MMIARFTCPRCRMLISVDDADFPLTCCSVRYTSPADLPLAKRGGSRPSRHRPSRKSAPTTGPGKNLKALLERIGFTDWAGCGCAAKVATMNEWGVAGCLLQRDTIIGWLREAAKRTGWLTKLAVSPQASLIIPPRHWLDPIPWLVDEAIHPGGNAPLPDADLAALSRTRIDAKLLLPAKYRLNNSLIRFQGRLLMAYRLNWTGSRIGIAELDERYRPIKNWELTLAHGDAQEDPRLWVYRGELHVSYTAFYPDRSAADVCYARLEETDDGWQAVEDFAPHYDDRDHWEKNWGFFEHAGELYCLYSIKMDHQPFRILRVEGERAWSVAEHACPFPGKEGRLHGGAPPVLFQGEYYCWYHRVLGRPGKERVYTLDLFTFEAKPPFRPARQIVPSLLLPVPADRPSPTVPHAIFPGGAFLERNAWWVSFGYYDAFCELVSYNMNELEQALEPLPGGPFAGIAYRREGEHDWQKHLSVWKQVNVGNEYRLPDDMTGQTVVDVGGHIGSFTTACLERGAAHVSACEPDSISRKCLEQNLARFGDRATIVPAYIVGRDDGTLIPQYAGPMSPDTSSSVLELGVLLQSLPRIDLLKLDCEGPEHGIADHTDLSRVPKITGEVHRVGERGLDSFVAALERQGFSVESERQGDGLWNFWAERKA